MIMILSVMFLITVFNHEKLFHDGFAAFDQVERTPGGSTVLVDFRA